MFNKRQIHYFSIIIFVLLLISGCKTLPSKKIISEAKRNQREIERLERHLKKNPDQFDWKVHNELRHLYSSLNPRKSMEHSNIILKNSVMDGYILSILSGWQLDKDLEKAEVNLLAKIKAYSDLKFIQAACWIQIADIYKKSGNLAMAESYYLKVLEIDSQGMEEYQVITELNLQNLSLEKEFLQQETPETSLQNSQISDKEDMQETPILKNMGTSQ